MSLIMGNVFVDGYGKCGDAEFARKVFDGMGERDVVTWTSLVGGYARAGRVEEARRVFDEMPVRNEISWTAMVSGYEQNGEEERALELFREMVGEGVGPTPFTLVSVLSSCARLGLIGRGKQVHAYTARRTHFNSNIFTCNTLIDMYSKCGDVESASAVFHSMNERDVISWNSMVTGYAHNGLGTQSLAIFERMIEGGVSPTHVTFLSVLSACSHAGLVSEGRQFLNVMKERYNVCPSSEHYAAFVDALGRKKKMEEAVELIDSLHSSNVGIWGALLGACQVHGDLKLGQRAAETLFALEPDNGARYVTLSNIYSAAGRWEEAKRIRVVMKKKGLRKDAGHSWIEVRSAKHVFGAAEGKSHSRSEEIYRMLNVLVNQMMDEEEIDRNEFFEVVSSIPSNS
ncbi:uncharacterized protein A4U43_C02F6420 [Asparagus officinalis]|uniref:Pentatricopeptide repeat-containing protein n=1 Tax=Asparagus officinalis TaxID=4686 RepID=A0A5P1FJ58_ASPOF|nr:uncharacterized protein A4U43_C02F6420 [Asparagus officinalis]